MTAHDEDDRIVSITCLTPHTTPVRIAARTVSVEEHRGGTLHPTWPVPPTVLRLVDPRAGEPKPAAPGPPLNLAVGKRSIMQRLKERLRRIA